MNRVSGPVLVGGHQALEPNPFRTAAVRPGAIPFLGGQSHAGDSLFVESLAATFLNQRSGQILGDHGSGKSTLVSSLLEYLQPSFHGVQHLCFVRPEFTRPWHATRHCQRVSKQLRQTLANCSADTLLVIDGAEQLSVLAYRQMIGSIGSKSIAVLATSHRKLRGMPVLFRAETNPSTIRELTRRQVRRSSDMIRNLVEADLMSRDLETISNLRDYWFELYDLVQPYLQLGDAYREQQCG